MARPPKMKTVYFDIPVTILKKFDSRVKKELGIPRASVVKMLMLLYAQGKLDVNVGGKLDD